MIAVVAGVVVRNGRVLVCQRPPGKALGLLWEFPGGKLEAGILDALRVKSAKDNQDLLVLFYQSEILSGEPEPLECVALAWALPGEIERYALAPADAQFARRAFRSDI